MASGVKVNDDAVKAVVKVRNRDCRACIFKLNDELSEIIVDKEYFYEKGSVKGNQIQSASSDGSEDLEFVKSELPESEPRYALLNFPYQNEEGHSREKLVFVAWSPDISKTKLKMLYASSKAAIVKAAESVKLIQASDMGELDYKEVKCKCMKK